MPRPARWSEDQILDAALALLATNGASALSVTAVADRLGAPSGSIYHRFAGRDHLVARLWLRSVSRFQDACLPALTADDPLDAARGLARAVLTWASDQPHEARLLQLHRAEDLLGDGWPADLRRANRAQRRRVTVALHDLATRLGADDDLGRRRVRLATVDVPSAELRGLLAGGDPPDELSFRLVDDAVVALLQP